MFVGHGFPITKQIPVGGAGGGGPTDGVLWGPNADDYLLWGPNADDFLVWD